MNIEIRKLTPELAEDYVHFFNKHHTMIMLMNISATVCVGATTILKARTSPQERSAYALRYVKGNNIQGYLAYSGDRVVGWCNANTKADCLKCASWRRFMKHVPIEEPDSGIKVKSVFCFVIAPDMKRKGIATLLLERVCEDAIKEGFDFVEAYPYREAAYQSSDFGGYYEMYKRSGFYVSLETDQGLVMRKSLR